MKSFRLLILAALFIPIFACNAQTENTANPSTSTDKVEAYYFHFNSRCVTCLAVESEAKTNIESLYGGKVSFQSINLDDASSKAIAEELKVSGQSLLIVKGATKINITNEGFMYARTNPEKFKSIIKNKVDGLLEL